MENKNTIPTSKDQPVIKQDFTQLFLGKLKPETKYVAIINNYSLHREYTPEGYIVAGSDKLIFDPIVFECEDNLCEQLFKKKYIAYKNGHWIIEAYEVNNGEIIAQIDKNEINPLSQNL